MMLIWGLTVEVSNNTIKKCVTWRKGMVLHLPSVANAMQQDSSRDRNMKEYMRWDFWSKQTFRMVHEWERVSLYPYAKIPIVLNPIDCGMKVLLPIEECWPIERTVKDCLVVPTPKAIYQLVASQPVSTETWRCVPKTAI